MAMALAAACMETPGAEEGQQQPEHRLFPSVPRLAFCILPLCLSVPVPPLPSPLPAWGMESSCAGAGREEEAPQEGPAALLGGCKPPRGSHCLCPQCQQHPGQHCLPASSAAQNELGGWQSVSETPHSRQKLLHAVSVSLQTGHRHGVFNNRDAPSQTRSRIILKQERRKQKEYFERKKLKSKMKLLEVSSPKSSAVSLDLLNLYVVNQISTKKENTENARKPVHVDITEDEKKPIRRHNLELPTSPLRTQHKSNLDDLQSRLQKQVLDSRRQHLSEKVKYQHKLIPQVMELGDVDSSTENEDDMARAFSACPLSSSGFQFSNCTQLSEENFNTKLMGNIWEQIYEKKLQNQPGNNFDQNPWNTNPPSQFIFRKSDTVPQELFQPFDRRLYPAINAKEDSVDRHLEGIFTAPEQIFLKSSNVSNTSYKETSALHKTHRQNRREGQHYFMPCEQKERRANLEKIETFAYHHDQQNSLKENVQNYSRKKSENKSVKETAWNQNHVFVFEEFTTAQEKGYKFGLSSYLHEMDVESPLSSQSHSYSPRQTESYLSSSPDTSEEEDTAKKKEYLNEHSLKAHGANLFSASASREAPKSSHTQSVGMKPSSTLPRKEANNLQERDSNFCATEEENKTHTALSQGPSHQACKREPVSSSTRRDVWSQTEGCVTVEKADVGSQCGTLRVCSCGGSLPAARSPGAVPAPSAAGNAGEPQGQKGTDPFSPEAEYLSLAGRSTLEVLNYIDKMKERDKR
ncbi:regulator of DNA class I crossover intermediates 1 isoform X3 [Passer domesticus]|uniref:regulator of DNA class I crossover intermediates 1 isoform X3 n=1 Tax=Passer domesticus TaxID=48849 RepID=UPI0030FE44EC